MSHGYRTEIKEPFPLLRGPDILTEGYFELEETERNIKFQAYRVHRDVIALWYRGLTLYRRGMIGPMDFSDLEDPTDRKAWELVSQLIGLSLCSAKAALDSILAGYYSVAFGTIRHILESFIQCYYVLCYPDDAVLWYSEAKEPTNRREPPKTKTMVSMIVKKQRHQRQFWNSVYRAWETMSTLAHPSGEGLIQLTDPIDNSRFVFGASYRENLFLVGADHALFAVNAMIEGIKLLKQLPPEWLEQQETLSSEIGQWRRQIAAARPDLREARPD